MTPNVITDPTREPISVAEAKSHLRVDSTAEDSILATYIQASRRRLECETGRAILTQTLEIVLDGFPADNSQSLVLPRATPLQSVTSIKYTDSDDVENTWSSTLYDLDTDRMPGSVKPIYGETWPSFTPASVNPIRVRYVAGADTVTEEIKQAMFLLVERYFDHRSNLADGRFVKFELGYGLQALITQLRVTYVF